MTSNVTINSRRLRLLTGILGIILPWVDALVFQAWPESISCTYYNVCTVGVFIAILGAASICLISYAGYSKADDIIATIAGIFGFLICLFPMTNLADPAMQTGILHLPSEISNIVHCISAAGFFGTIAYMSFFRFTKSTGEMTKQKKIRNIIYRVCGIGMLASFLLFFLQYASWCPYNLTWIIEAIALFFFGISWIVKAGAFPFLKDKETK